VEREPREGGERQTLVSNTAQITKTADPIGSEHPVLEIDRSMTLGDLAAVAYEHRPVRLTAAARGRIEHARDTVDQLLQRNWLVYGLTTGVGALKRVAVAADAQSDFNR
jgi:histidine ammonia-lyase